MTHPQKHIDDLENKACDRELVRLLSPDRDIRLKNQDRATQLRDRIAMLKARLVKLHQNRPEN